MSESELQIGGKPENYSEFQAELFALLDKYIPQKLEILTLFQKKVQERAINPSYKNPLALDHFLTDIMTKDFVLDMPESSEDVYTAIFQGLETLKKGTVHNHEAIFQNLTDGDAQHLLLTWVNDRLKQH